MAQFEIKDGVAIIPDGTTYIGYNAFRYCTSLKSITIPESVTEIGGYAFEGCTSLENITISEGVTEIGLCAFIGCTSLESIIIPNSVTEIGHRAFKDCTSLESITIPESVTKIASAAFEGCNSLESIIVADGNSVYDSREGCNAIIETATNTLIQGCKTTVIPESVTEIGSEAFYDCTSLVTINVPAKKFYYYKERLSEDWHDKIVELAPEKKTKTNK